MRARSPEKPTILVVDDTEANRLVVEGHLVSAGYTVVLASSGEEALELFEASAFDLALIDVMMGGIDGFETTRQIRRLTGGDLPVLLLTALGESEVRERALSVGADDFLGKPIRGLELIMRVRSLVRLRRLQIELRDKSAALRAAAEERADRSERRYRTLFDAGRDAVIIHEPDGAIIDGNLRAESYLGRTVEELRSLTIRDIAPEIDLGSSTDLLDGGVEPNEALETHLVRADGSEFPVEVFLTSVELATGFKVMVILRDISARLAAQRALQETETQLRQVQKLEALGALAGGVAHDFNNILTAIVAFSEFVKSDLPADHPNLPDVDEVLRAAESASKLTSQLLAFARRSPLQPEVVDVNAALSSTQKMLRRTVGESIELVVHLSEDDLRVEVDPGALDQVIFNLAVNSRDAMPEGGGLTIALGLATIESNDDLAPGEYVTLSVADEGAGISPEALGKIFDPFFSTKGEKGTGLGLATCYGIAKQAGGSIRVKSTLGVGTVFTVLLPRVSSLVVPAEMGEEALLSGMPEDAVVLVVEDQPSILRLVVRSFKRSGHRVIEARTAEEALAVLDEFESGAPDLLVTDVVLPNKSGVWLMEAVRERWPHLPVVLTSGYMGEEGPLPQADAATAFVPKPFSGRDLLRASSRLLARARGSESST